jgi:uncharacterized delta-60 repeat protein
LAFGVGGLVTIDFGSNEIVTGLALAPDGDIVVVGKSEIPKGGPWVTSHSAAVARLNPNGTLDSGFSGDGKLLASKSSFTDVVEQPDSRIVTGGSNTAPDFLLTRYLANGNLDNGFGSKGKVTTDFLGGSNDVGEALVRQGDGKLLLAGQTAMPGVDPLAVARYLTNGSLDPSFGVGGKVTVDVHNNRWQHLEAAAVYPNTGSAHDGKIVLLARFDARDVQQSDNLAVVRLNADGSLDGAFGTAGVVKIDVGDDYAGDVALQADGKFVLAGSVYGLNEFMVIRLTENGTFDTSFSGDGLAAPQFFGYSYENAENLEILADGRIVVAGWVESPTTSNHLALARLNPDGSLDGSFGGDGTVSIDLFEQSGGGELVVQPDGKYVAAASKATNFLVARFNTDGTHDASPLMAAEPAPTGSTAIPLTTMALAPIVTEPRALGGPGRRPDRAGASAIHDQRPGWPLPGTGRRQHDHAR